MNEKLIQKSKWFWAWQDDREEAWLGEMSRQGLHLLQAAVFGRYTFEPGEPREYAYRLDFVTIAKKSPDYFQLFRDAGWEHVGEVGGWQYWRKEIVDGKVPEIFTDNASKVLKYQRLLGFLAIVFFPVAMGLFNMRNFSVPDMVAGSWIEWVFVGIEMLIFAVFICYIFVFIRLWMRVHQLRKP